MVFGDAEDSKGEALSSRPPTAGALERDRDVGDCDSDRLLLPAPSTVVLLPSEELLSESVLKSGSSSELDDVSSSVQVPAFLFDFTCMLDFPSKVKTKARHSRRGPESPALRGAL
jgi:hypothetical protein